MTTVGALTVNFSIRPAGPEDVETLRTLVAAMGYQVSSQELHTRLQALPEGHAVYVAESGSDRIGYIHVLISHSLIVGPRIEIAGLAVAPHAQGRGVGSALLSAVEKWDGATRGTDNPSAVRSGTERSACLLPLARLRSGEDPARPDQNRSADRLTGGGGISAARRTVIGR
jgi:GNAT superfamily N-acetyltransferase